MIRRRRECLQCDKRFTTYERLEVIPMIVLKSDDRREPFSREKLREGLSRACKKRNITADQIEKIVGDIETSLQEDFVMEVPSKSIGERVMAKLKELDHVAYIRFASVYKQFSDVDSFFHEVRGLKHEQKIKNRKNQSIDLLSTFVNEQIAKN